MSEHHPAGHAHHHTMHHTQEPPAEPGYPEHPKQAHHEGGRDKHAGHSVEMFRNKFWLSLLLTIPTVISGHMLMRLTGYMPLHSPAHSGSRL